MSIRVKLTLWYTGLLVTTLLGFSLVAYAFTGYLLNRQVKESLALKAQEVMRSVTVVDLAFLQRVVLPDVDVFANPDTYLQVVDTSGRVIARSANLGQVTLPITQRRAQSQAAAQFVTVEAHGQTLRILFQPLAVNGQVVGVLQVAQPLRPVGNALAGLRQVLSMIGALAVLVAAGMGWWLARTALRPVEQITATARAIQSGSDLERRVLYFGPQDEVGMLAATMNGMLDRVETAYRRLEEAYTAQRRFVADASHELRTPLTTIRGNVEWLQKAVDADAGARREALDDIAGEARRMSRLVSDLLVLARADSGQHLERGPVEVDQLLHTVARRAKTLAVRHDFRVDVDGVKGALLSGDRDRLQELFMVLLDNAFKYTSPGGQVWLTAELVPNRVEASVRDTGPGISETDLPHVFERFYRADTARHSTGSGLGLSIALWVAREHGGDIRVESKPGRGSCFTVTLPAKTEGSSQGISG